MAAEYLLACRLGAGQCAEYRRRAANRVMARDVAARKIPWVLTARGVRLVRILAALQTPAPARWRGGRVVPGPIARAVEGALVQVLVDHVFGLPAYDARVRRELVAG